MPVPVPQNSDAVISFPRRIVQDSTISFGGRYSQAETNKSRNKLKMQDICSACALQNSSSNISDVRRRVHFQLPVTLPKEKFDGTEVFLVQV